MSEPLPSQSVLADMVQLAPKIPAMLAAVSLPDDNPIWGPYKRMWTTACAWVLYWKAAGECPDLDLTNAGLLAQVNASFFSFAGLANEKLVISFPEQKAALERIRLAGEVYGRGLMVMQQVLWEPPV